MRPHKEAASNLQSFYAAEKIICDGMSEVELGIELGLSVNTVKKRVLTGLRRASCNLFYGPEMDSCDCGYIEIVERCRKQKNDWLEAIKKVKTKAEKQIETHTKRKIQELWADEHGIRSVATAKRLLMALGGIEITISTFTTIAQQEETEKNNWERVEIFDDSNELSDELRKISDSAGMPNEFKYYLRKAAKNIDGMLELLGDLKKEHAPLKPKAINKNKASKVK